MPVTTRGRIVAATAALALAVSTAACSNSTKSGGAATTGAPTSSAAESSSTKALGAPRLGGTKDKHHRNKHRHQVKPTPTPTPTPTHKRTHPHHRHHVKPTPSPTPTPTPTHKRTHTHRPPAHAPATGSVYAIGDSVMIDAQSNLYSDIASIKVDADVSRQASSGVYVVQQQRASGTLADTTIFGLGTNGTFSSSELSELISLTAGHHLIIITSHCPYCGWTDSNNAMIHQLCTAANHCAIADFQAQAEQHPEWFGSDGVHMAIGGTGAAAYAQVVASAYASLR
jgi:hypothetical protein